MNTQPLEIITSIDSDENETERLEQCGFTADEIISLLWLQQWYQHGGSDRAEILRNLEYIKLLVGNGQLDA